MAATLERHCLFTADSGFGARRAPPRPAVMMMLVELERELKELSLAPAKLSCESWWVPRSDADRHSALARIRIEAAPGELKTSLACWYEWQHPHWRFTGEPWPVLDDLRVLRPPARAPQLPQLLHT